MNTIYILVGISVVLNAIVLAAVIYLFLMEKRDLGGIRKTVRSAKRIKAKSAEIFENEAEEELSRMVKGYVHSLSNEVKEQLSGIGEAAAKQSGELAAFVQDQQKAIISETQTMVANNVVKIEKDLEDYKKSQFERIETEINSIVAATASKVLGRMVSLTEHEELVRQALERAKKDKFFA